MNKKGFTTDAQRVRRLCVCLLSSLCAVCLGGFLTPANGAEFTATKADGAITIDGQLNEAAWKSAPAWGSFTPLGTRTEERALAPTQFKLLRGDQAIYLGITCDEPNMAQLKATPSSVNSMGLYNNDCLEIFLDPAGQGTSYYHLAVSAANSHFSEYRIEGGGTTGGYYSPIWKSAIHKGAKSWTAEIKIPLSALYYTNAGQFSDTWGVSVARERLAVSPRQLSAWPKLKRSFHEPKHFNRVSDMPRKNAAFDVRLGLATAQLVPAGSDTYTGSIRFKTDADAKAAGPHTLTLSRDGKTWAAGKVTIPRGQGEVAIDSVPFDQQGKLAMLATLRDSKGQVVHQQRIELEAQYQPLAIEITRPFYANCIFPDQSITQIEGVVTANLPADSLAGATLVVALEGPGLKTPTPTRLSLKGRTAAFSLDAANLPVGDYSVTCRLEKQGKTLATHGVSLRKLARPKQGSYVYIDRDLNLVVNGKPVFVRGWYGGPVYAMSTALRNKLGMRPDSPDVNAWQCQVGMEAERLDPTQKGQRITQDVKPSQKVFDEMLKRIEKAKDNPGTWWYYLCDEPECRGVSPVYLKYQYDFIKKHDPYHPVMIISREPDKFVHCADILNPHPYLNPRVDASGKRSMSSVKKVRDEMRLVLSSGKGRIPPWLTPQSFSYGFNDSEARYPNFAEFRCMIYTAVANGARGFTPFMYADHFNTLDLRRGVPFIYHTLASINLFLLSPQKPMPMRVEAADDGVDAWAKTVDGTTLLIAVNLLDRPMTATISSDGLKSVTQLVGYRELTTAAVKEGAVTLHFEPYQVHLLSSRKIDGDLQSVEAFESELAKTKKAMKETGGILYGRGREIEWDASSAWNGLGGSPINIMHSLCDGITDAYGWIAGKPGAAWIGMLFPKFVPTFQRARIYGANIQQVRLQYWKRGEWQEGATVSWKADVPYVDVTLPKPVRTVKIRLNFPQVKSAGRAEVYEVELFEH